ncbi:hypothetical protein MPSEU_000085200 [Mayamaea pseudoterrestris]|nr:hypothetical protein MPSEU_000085200 [Mayamaea pseudoterrestris]
MDATENSGATQLAETGPRNGANGRNVKRNRGPRKKRQQKVKLDEQPQQEEKQPQTLPEHAPKANAKPRPRKKGPRRRYPWRKHIPADTVDPITLESLVSLPYPPFALVASEPYDPVREWPIPKATEVESQLAVEIDVKETEEERRMRVLQEQWGNTTLGFTAKETGTNEIEGRVPLVQPEKRHYHLYDGRALAYYMVSQLQFIDPLNRRDLTRREIQGLDHYLKKHGFSSLSVTEAYDKRGITISTAGAAGNTQAGRAAILQQEATQLLNALFGTHPSAPQQPASSAPPTSRLRAQYQAYAREDAEPAQHRPPRGRHNNDDVGIYGEGGFYVIDDALNPELRGSTQTFVHDAPRGGMSNANSLWSASHIARSFRSVTPQPVDFPALSETMELLRQADAMLPDPVPQKKTVATLSLIAKAVKKTNPEELQRQREAREDALRRAAAANLPFGMLPPEPSSVPPVSTITTVTEPVISDALLERNMALADALGIKSTRAEVESDRAAFVDELRTTVYPDSLIFQAKERPALLLKLEKKWTQLVTDKAASSLSLTPMDRPTRVFVHEYSDFWNLETQSYDPEGKRYIHCRKQLDARVPMPLLSEAVRNWKGPLLIMRPLPTGPELRAPLVLKPRTLPFDTNNNTGKIASTGIPMSGGATRTMMNDVPDAINSRVDGLVSERPKLQLQQRSLPLELPQMDAKSKSGISSELERQQDLVEERARKEMERKQRVLENAFASDDERSLDSDVDYQGAW